MAVLGDFRVVKLATEAIDEVGRRIQHETRGYRGRNGDRRYRFCNILRVGQEKLTDRRHERLARVGVADQRHTSVEVAWRFSWSVRSVYHQDTPGRGRVITARLIESLPTSPLPEIARLGRTLRKWRDTFLAYFDTDGSVNGGTEAITDLIELHRRVARGFRNYDNYRLRMLLIGGGL